MGAVRHFFPSLFFGLCPRRQALPEVDELGDVEDGLGPIVNSFQTEDNDLTTAKPKEGETSSEGQEKLGCSGWLFNVSLLDSTPL
eukprot:symbB.v1.2.037673.t2/scaffold5629.1/size25172/3